MSLGSGPVIEAIDQVVFKTFPKNRWVLSLAVNAGLVAFAGVNCVFVGHEAVVASLRTLALWFWPFKTERCSAQICTL